MMNEILRRHLFFWPAAVVGLVLDLATKSLVFDWLRFDWGTHLPRERTVIDGFFNLSTSLNTGTFFGRLSGQNTALVAFTVLMVVVVVAMFLIPPRELRAGRGAGVYALALGLVLAGAAGNLWDRVVHDGVRDFLAFRIFGYPWPTFNLADAWLTVGIGAYLLAVLRAPDPEPKKNAEAAVPAADKAEGGG